MMKIIDNSDWDWYEDEGLVTADSIHMMKKMSFRVYRDYIVLPVGQV